MLIRSALLGDLNGCLALDANSQTDHVWQMGKRSTLAGVIDINFREIRLPRIMRVTYPRSPDLLADEWSKRLQVLVAEKDGRVCGYSALMKAPAPGAVWLTDLVVGLPERRTGVGSGLLLESMRWSAASGFDRIFAELQSKNYPAVSLLKKFGFSFSGYSDSYFPDQDIALFFVGDCRAPGKESGS